MEIKSFDEYTTEQIREIWSLMTTEDAAREAMGKRNIREERS